MATTETAPPTFADWLRSTIEERHLSVRGLAKLMNPDTPEVPRRALHHYLRGGQPNEQNAQLLAAALGVDRGSLPIHQGAGRSADPFRPGLATDVRRGHGEGDRAATRDEDVKAA